jgi:uncharacterized protein YecE (DUF72 family)
MKQAELRYETTDERDPRVYERATTLAARAPTPARLGRVLAGTAGWTDPTLIKSHTFYPRGVSDSEARLRYYATQFPLVEVDASYYALPTPVNAERWVARTPADFTFNVKAFAALTQHPVDLLRLPKDIQAELPEDLRARHRVYPKDLPGEIEFEIWKRFRQAIEPLHKAGKLGCVLLQFPPWFTATRANAKFLEVCRARLEKLPLAVEFRHPSWGDAARVPRVMALLRRAELSYVAVDEPQGTAASMPPVVEVADPKLAVVRFHGRRAETWDAGASVQEKFDYLYDPAELRPWVPKVERLAQQAERVHLVFNNCVENRAVLGARDIVALMAEAQASPTARSA